MNQKTKDSIIMGFALFSIFFGAGNLIFPPYIGVSSGAEWLTSFAGFILADVGLVLVFIYAIAHAGSFQAIVGRAGQRFGLGLELIIMLLLGPILVIPRTGATTYEMSIMPNFNVSPVLFSILFFILVFGLSIKQTKVMDIIGKVLTPILLGALLILIVKGTMSPVGELQMFEQGTQLFAHGVNQGYQTMDPLPLGGVVAFLMASLVAKGYTKKADRISITIKAGVVAAAGLTLVYAGLTYLGATASGILDASASQASLLVDITQLVLGEPGKIILGIIVAFACLTTAVGLTSVIAKFLEEVTNKRVKYAHIILGICVFSTMGANLGVDQLIGIAAPMLSIIYPVTTVLVLMSCFDRLFTSDLEFKFAAYTTLAISILTVLNVEFVQSIYLAEFGFNWFIPAIISILVAKLIRICLSTQTKKSTCQQSKAMNN